MDWLRRSFVSARLSIRMQRFEVAAATLLMLALSGGAVLVTGRLSSVGVSERCLERWIGGGGPFSAGTCLNSMQQWAAINEDEAGKVMAAMFVLPFVAGLLLGVPLVGRELEARTAAVAWALAGSRRRWLTGRMVPILLLTVGIAAIAAMASSLLEAARSGNGLWVSAFNDASLFGPPVVAHALAGLGLGMFAGALLGRTLPALIVGAVLAVLVANASIGVRWRSVPDSNLIQETPSAQLDPAYDFRWVTADGQMLSRDEALATVPPTTVDIVGWLNEHYRPLYLGPSETTAVQWQQSEVAAYLLGSGVLLLATFALVDRRRPT